MSRTINEIYTDIITKKDSLEDLEGLGYAGDDTELLLQDLNSSSKVAIWRLWAYVTAVTIYFHEKLWDLFKAEVEEKLKAIPGTDAWLVNECKKFQNGDLLIFNNDGTYGYASPKPDDQIIERVSVSSQFGNSVVKVAKEGVGGGLSPLSVPEMTAFKEYLNQIQYAGSSIVAVTGESDKITLPLSVYYNAQIPLTDLRPDVETAVLNYLANLEFDGAFKLIRLIDAIQVIEGVLDVTVNGASAKPHLGSPIEITREYRPVSGYIEIDDAAPLSSSINYSIE